jgi:hypothetical protein
VKQYKGAVFFVDMLGINALTQKKVSLTDMDYKARGILKTLGKNEQVFCAKLLMKFRACLGEAKRHHQRVKVAQLSDCAFVWSKDVSAVVQAAQDLMWSFARSGLLCRGGISYGEIVEPDKVATSLGHFVLGAAATDAVDHEKKGKGFRVFANEEIVKRATVKDIDLRAFGQLKNPLDGSVVQEFRWYFQGTPASRDVDVKTKIKSVLEVTSLLRHSALFNWNASSGLGLQQLNCSIDSLASAVVLLAEGTHYRFATQKMINVVEDRTEKSQKAFLKLWLSELEDAFKSRSKRRFE